MKKRKIGTEMDHFSILLTTDTAISVTNGFISVKKSMIWGIFKNAHIQVGHNVMDQDAISVTYGVISVKKEKRPPISHVSVNDNETFHCNLLK